MARRPRQQSTTGERGLGMELRRLRNERRLSLKAVGDPLGWSTNTVSRLERGQRPDTTTEEVSAVCAVLGVKGTDRDRLLDMTRRSATPGWFEQVAGALSDQSRMYGDFEHRATAITDVEPLLVPGLLQIPEYTRAVMIAGGIQSAVVDARLAGRLGRQAILSRPQPPQLLVVVTELALRQPIGGHEVMARQVRHLAESAEQPHISFRIIPSSAAAHAALTGAFVILEFASEPTVVHVESRTTGLFRDAPEEIESYKLAVARLTDVALGDQESVRLLHTVAHDLARE